MTKTMTKQAGAALAQQLVDEVTQMVPEYLKDPDDFAIGKGNAAVCSIAPDGSICGRIFGDDKARGRFSFGIVNRKVIQVWSTGYATGRFEQLVYAGKVDEAPFGINKPDFVGWEGGVPYRRTFAAPTVLLDAAVRRNPRWACR